MTKTNLYNIPQVFVDACSNDGYTKSGADFSVTGLIRPPQIVKLQRDHEELMVSDVREDIWSLLGRGVHEALEKAVTRTGSFSSVTEERQYATVEVAHPDTGESEGDRRLVTRVMPSGSPLRTREGMVEVLISGQLDLREGTSLTDYKVTSTYTHLRAQVAGKREWEEQVNIYRWLAEMNGCPITDAEIHMVLRDWIRSRAMRDPSYPQSPIAVMPIKLWTMPQAQSFVEQRVRMHLAAKPEPCTPEERWASGSWNHKPPVGRSKKYDTLAEANTALQAQGGAVTEAVPEYKRCEQNWCGVSQFCPQFQSEPRK